MIFVAKDTAQNPDQQSSNVKPELIQGDMVPSLHPHPTQVYKVLYN